MNIVLRGFLHNNGSAATDRASTKSGLCPTLIEGLQGFFTVPYHRQNCTLRAFELFGALYMHNIDNKYPTGRDSNPVGLRLSFEPQRDRISNRNWQFLWEMIPGKHDKLNQYCFNPLTAKLFNLILHPLEVVSRWRDLQPQVSENYSDFTKWRSTLFKSCWLMSHFIFNILKMRYLMC